MPIVQAKCTACNGNLEVDSQKEAAVCPFCGTPYIVEKAINHFHAASTKIESFHADVVNISAESQLETLVKSGETFMMLNKFSDARRVFDEITRKYPQDYRGWWGLIKVNTENLTRVSCYDEDLAEHRSLLNNIHAVSNSDIYSGVDAEYNGFTEKVEQYRSEKADKIKNLIAEQDNLVAHIRSEIEALRVQKRMQKDIHKIVLWVSFAVVTIIVFVTVVFEAYVALTVFCFAAIIFYCIWVKINDSPNRPYKRKQAQYEVAICAKEQSIEDAYGECNRKIRELGPNSRAELEQNGLDDLEFQNMVSAMAASLR